MQRLSTFTSALLLAACSYLHAQELPLHPQDAQVVQAILATEEVSDPVVTLGEDARASARLRSLLEEVGVTFPEVKTVRIQKGDNNRAVIQFYYNSEGRVVAITGNGPWLRNETLTNLVNMPELLHVSMDHNGHVGRHPRIDLYDGSTWSALADSKIASVAIGLSFNNLGMESIVKLRNLRRLRVFHGRTNNDGLGFLAGHPTLRIFEVGEMGKVTSEGLAHIAKMPHLSRLGFLEAYATFDNGFAHLTPLAGQLKAIDLSMSVITESDLSRLRAAFPNTEITGVMSYEDIAKRHRGVAGQLARQTPDEIRIPLAAAIEAARR